jgi:hypothetical protein
LTIKNIDIGIGHNDILDESAQTFGQNLLLNLLTRAQIPQNSRTRLAHIIIMRALHQPNKRRYSATIANLQLVIIIRLAVREVPQSATRVLVHLGDVRVEQRDETPDTAEKASLSLLAVVLVDEVL